MEKNTSKKDVKNDNFSASSKNDNKINNYNNQISLLTDGLKEFNDIFNCKNNMVDDEFEDLDFFLNALVSEKMIKIGIIFPETEDEMMKLREEAMLLEHIDNIIDDQKYLWESLNFIEPKMGCLGLIGDGRTSLIRNFTFIKRNRQFDKEEEEFQNDGLIPPEDNNYIKILFDYSNIPNIIANTRNNVHCMNLFAPFGKENESISRVNKDMGLQRLEIAHDTLDQIIKNLSENVFYERKFFSEVNNILTIKKRDNNILSYIKNVFSAACIRFLSHFAYRNYGNPLMGYFEYFSMKILNPIDEYGIIKRKKFNETFFDSIKYLNEAIDLKNAYECDIVSNKDIDINHAFYDYPARGWRILFVSPYTIDIIITEHELNKVNMLKVDGYTKQILKDLMTINVDDKEKKIDKTKVSTEESWERDYWTKTLNVSIQELDGAIKATRSHRVKVIKKYLRD
jgi:uncharacterized protein DUF3606